MAFSVLVLAKVQGGAGRCKGWYMRVSMTLRNVAWWNVGVPTRSKVDLLLGKKEPWHMGVLLSVHLCGWRCPAPMLSRVAGQDLNVHMTSTWGGIYPSECLASNCDAKGYSGIVKEGSRQSHGHFLFKHGGGKKGIVGVIWYFHISQVIKFQVITQIKTAEQATTKLHFGLPSSPRSVQRGD